MISSRQLPSVFRFNMSPQSSSSSSALINMGIELACVPWSPFSNYSNAFLNPLHRDKAQLDYLQNAYARLAEQCSVKRAESADAKKVKKEEMDKAPKADTPTASQSVEEPQPGCSRSFDFRTLKAVLPDVEDDLIEVNQRGV